MTVIRSDRSRGDNRGFRVPGEVTRADDDLVTTVVDDGRLADRVRTVGGGGRVREVGFDFVGILGIASRVIVRDDALT